MSERWPTLGSSAVQAIRPPTTGWSSAGGVPDVEPRIAHSSGHSFNTPSRAESAAEFAARIERESQALKLDRALIDLDRRTAGRTPTRSERRLRARYLRSLETIQGEQP